MDLEKIKEILDSIKKLSEEYNEIAESLDISKLILETDYTRKNLKEINDINNEFEPSEWYDSGC